MRTIGHPRSPKRGRRRKAAVLATGALVLAGAACASASVPAPALRPGWPPSGESAPGPPAVDADGRVYLSVREGIVVLNPDGTRRALIRGSRLDPPVRGRDGRIYALRYRGERLVRVGADGRLEEVGGRVPFGRQLTLTDVSVGGRPVGVLTFNSGFGDPTALGPGEIVYAARRSPGIFIPPGPNPFPATLRAVAPDGAVVWSRDLPADPGILVGAPDGSVRLALELGPLLAFASDGTPLWSAEVDGIPQAIAVAADGTTYVTSGSRVVPYGYTLTAFGPDGSLRFARALPGTPGAPAVAGDGTVFVPITGPKSLRRGVVLVLSPLGALRFRLALPAPAAGIALAEDGSLIVAVSGASMLLALASPLRPAPAQTGLGLSHRRFRSAGPVSVCPAPAACRPETPLGTTLAVDLAARSRIGIAVRRQGARAAIIRSSAGDFPAGPARIRFDGRSQPGSRAAIRGPLRSLCGGPTCTPLAPGGYRITVTLRVLRTGALRHLSADVTILVR